MYCLIYRGCFFVVKASLSHATSATTTSATKTSATIDANAIPITSTSPSSISTSSFSELDMMARTVFGIQDGRCHITISPTISTSTTSSTSSSTASSTTLSPPLFSSSSSSLYVSMLYIDAKITTPVTIPFKQTINIANKRNADDGSDGSDGSVCYEVSFDDIEPHPAIQHIHIDIDIDNNNNNNINNINIYSSDVDIDVDIDGITVSLTSQEFGHFLQTCGTCFGYTAGSVRCQHKLGNVVSHAEGKVGGKVGGREGGREKEAVVWCNRHKKQECEYKRFRIYGDRPQCCTWWK